MQQYHLERTSSPKIAVDPEEWPNKRTQILPTLKRRKIRSAPSPEMRPARRSQFWTEIDTKIKAPFDCTRKCNPHRQENIRAKIQMAPTPKKKQNTHTHNILVPIFDRHGYRSKRTIQLYTEMLPTSKRRYGNQDSNGTYTTKEDPHIGSNFGSRQPPG